MRKMRQPFVSTLISGIFNALYPETCPACSRATDNTRYAPFCSDCWSAISRYSGASCKICAEPYASAASGTCGHCLKDPPPFSKAVSFGIYEEVLARAIHALKFQQIRRLHKPLGELMLQLDLPHVDAVVPVPLHAQGLRERGFNQALLLAKVIAAEAGVPLVIDGLIKGKATLPQLGLTAKERAANLAGAFSAVRGFPEMTLLLVDDVMTTGATVRACSRELRRAGATDVVVCTLARAAAT